MSKVTLQSRINSWFFNHLLSFKIIHSRKEWFFCPLFKFHICFSELFFSVASQGFYSLYFLSQKWTSEHTSRKSRASASSSSAASNWSGAVLSVGHHSALWCGVGFSEVLEEDDLESCGSLLAVLRHPWNPWDNVAFL